MPDFLIGCDIGTSSVKTVLADSAGTVHAISKRAYRMRRPHPGWAENDPEDWVEAVEWTIKDVLGQVEPAAEDVKGLAIVAQRDPIVFLDREGAVLAPSISWLDMRDMDETEDVYRDFGRDALIETTGLMPVPALALPVIHWVRKHRPDVWSKTAAIAAAKDFVLFRLTGRMATDTSLPARSMLYDLRQLDWSLWICDKAGIDTGQLPPVAVKPWERWGPLKPEVASRLGLREDVVVAAGGADDMAATLGGGGIAAGDLVVGTGTASCWRVVTDRALPDKSEKADLAPHVIPDAYVYEFVVTGTGTSFRWFREKFARDRDGTELSYEDLIKEAESVPPGARGLFFYPFLEGSRAPRYDEQASGVFFGVRAYHDRAHFVRAILEGIAFQYPLVLRDVETYGAKVNGSITLVDDESRSALWNQIKADITGVAIETLKGHNAAAMGAAILAALAADVFPDVRSAVDSMVSRDKRYEPRRDMASAYGRIRDRYERVYRHLANAYDAASADIDPNRSATPFAGDAQGGAFG